MRKIIKKTIDVSKNIWIKTQSTKPATYLRKTRIVALCRRYINKRVAVALLIVFLFSGFAAVRAGLYSNTKLDTTLPNRQVRVAPAGFSTKESSILDTTGIVKSQIQGDLRTQRSGIVTNVYSVVGDKVIAGTIIASIENASELASVAQAQAGVSQAKANFDKVSKGTRKEQLAILEANSIATTQALHEAQAFVKNTLRNTYASTSNSFRGGVDSMFIGATTVNPKLMFTTTNSQQSILAEHERFLLQNIIEKHENNSITISKLPNNDLIETLDSVEKDELLIIEMLDNLILALDGSVQSNKVSNTELSVFKTTAKSVRANILASLSSLSSARSTINNAESASTVAQQNKEIGIIGAQKEDIQLAQAKLDSANASYAQAIAQLDKTRVKAPVSGVISTLTISKGDFVSAFKDVGLVAQSNALEIETFVSVDVFKRLFIGDKVIIDGDKEGIITSIASGVDSVRKQIQVQTGLVKTDNKLVNGSRVSVTFVDMNDDNTTSVLNNINDTTLLVPISSLKLVGNDAFVFTVDDASILSSIAVELGEIVQDSVTIKSGLESSTIIVIDARGLNNGDKVEIIN